MGAPVGNSNATKNRIWQQAILNALKKRSKSDQLEALEDLADKLIDSCMDGDITALKELGDRVEGKVAQCVNLGGQDDNPIKATLTVEFLK